MRIAHPLAEELQNTVYAVSSITELLANQRKEPISNDNLYFLMNLIVEKQTSLVDQLLKAEIITQM